MRVVAGSSRRVATRARTRLTRGGAFRSYLLLAYLALSMSVGCARAGPAATPADFSGGVAGAARHPAQAPCRIHTSPPHQRWGAPIPLLLTQGEAPFAQAYRTQALLSVAPAGARITLDDGWLSLTALTTLKQVRVFPRRAALQAAYALLPGASAALVSVTREQAVIERRLAGPLRPADDQPVRWSLGCDELSLSRVDFDAGAALTLLRRTGYAYAQGGQRLALSPAPEQAPEHVVVHLTPREWLELSLYEQRGEWARVAYVQGVELVTGWTRREALTLTPQPAARVSYAEGERYALPRRVGAQRCAAPLTIGVLRGATATELGVLRAGAFVSWDGAELPPRGLVSVQVPHASWLELAPGASLVVRAEELQRCEG